MPTVDAVRVRRTGLCPTLERPSLQRDGLLIRVPLVGGSLTIDQLELLADLAEQHGNGVVELTNRGNLQLRGLGKSSVATVVAELAAVGLGDAMSRIVTISPLAGPREHELRTAVVEALEAMDLDGLSGKFVVHVDDGSRGSGRHADVVLARDIGDTVMVDLAGDRESMTLVDAVALVQRVVTRCIAGGQNVRWKDVAEAAGVRVDNQAAFEPPVGPVRSAAGNAFVAGIPLGRTSPGQLREVGGICRACGIDEVRVTPWRSIMLIHTGVGTESGTTTLAARLGEAGLITSVDDPAHGVVACIGRNGCWQTELDTLAAATDAIARRSAGSTAGAPRPVGTLHVSGCAKSCATTEPVDVLLLGRDDSSGFDIVGATGECS